MSLGRLHWTYPETRTPTTHGSAGQLRSRPVSGLGCVASANAVSAGMWPRPETSGGREHATPEAVQYTIERIRLTMSAGGGKKAIMAALTANAGIAVAKFVGAAITGSASMFAEAMHSVADTSNQGLLLIGQRRAAQEADELHPFG